jgi:hypothetical protein
MRKTKKGTAQPLIYQALKQPRTPVEAKKYIREKYNVEVDLRTIYYHINRIKEGKDPDYILKTIPTIKGQKYCFIYKKEEQQADKQYLQWFLETYKIALEKKDNIKLNLLHKDLLHICQKKTINDGQFIDYFIKQAKKNPCDYLENLYLTINTWDYLVLIRGQLQKTNDPQYKKLKKLDIFFQNVTLNNTRSYGIERLEAYQKLLIIESPKATDVTFRLLETIDPHKRIVFAPSPSFSVTEIDLFLVKIHSQIIKYSNQNPEECRKKLFEAFDIRKKQFGEKDKGQEIILNMLEKTRINL